MPLEHCLPTMPTLLATPPARHHLEADVASWHYPCPRRSRAHLAIAVALSVGVHGFVIFGLDRNHHVVPVRRVDEEAIALVLTMPKLEDLQDPPPVTEEKTDVVMDASVMMPSQPDLPRLVLANDFVQQLDLSSLVQPDLNAAKMLVIPEHLVRGGRGDGTAGIFNLADLDRAPEPTFQPLPVFPPDLKQTVLDARVLVEFIVDARGSVVSAVIVESSHAGFNEAAVAGVNKWRFRPGLKGGRKVGARMTVPIIFRLVDQR